MKMRKMQQHLIKRLTDKAFNAGKVAGTQEAAAERKKVANFSLGCGIVIGWALIFLCVTVIHGVKNWQAQKKAEETYVGVTWSPGTPVMTPNVLYPDHSWEGDDYAGKTNPAYFDKELAYDKGFSDGADFTKGTLRMIRRNEKKLGRSLTDEEIKGIIETREKEVGAIIQRHTQ